MKDPDFRGVYPALTTPFRDDLSLDADGLARLTEVVIGDGVHGLVVNGCTGESWALTNDERATVFRITVEAARGRVRVPTRRRLELFAQIATAGCLPFGVFRADDDQTWIARMILDGLLSVPMDTALCPYSPVSVAIEGEGQPWVWALFN